MRTFRHSGKIGDVVWSLPFMAQHGGGTLLLQHGQYDYPPRAEPEERFNQRAHDFLLPLLEAQPYVTEVAVYKDQRVDYDLDRLREVVERTYFADLPGAYFAALGARPTQDYQSTPWLVVPDGARSPTTKKIIVSRTSRYLYKTKRFNKFYRDLRNRGLGEQGAFIGFPEEHALFCEQYGCAIEHVKVESALDVAAALKQADLYVGNENMVGTIAEALKVTAFREIRKDAMKGYCMFRRANLFYI